MKPLLLLRSALLLSLLAGVGCGGERTSSTSDEAVPADEAPPPTTPGEALDQMQDVFEADGPRASAPVDFRVLRDLLPETLAGLPRTEREGETSGFAGFSVSTAEATYRTEGTAPDLEVTISDLGMMPNLSLFGLPWLGAATIDRESDTGYERTTRLQGFPAYEKFERDASGGDAGDAEINVLVGNRFLVQLDGDHLPMARVREALDALDLRALDALKGTNMPN